MKIKRLSIHNIESLQQANIDFDTAPLRDAELFLIFGETGAGKTTILNSICLALYNATPALKAINDNGTDTENIQINNPQQLLRRGSAEGEVVLTFEGNDGKSYSVSWSTRRAHGKADGKLQGVKRSLECITDGTKWQKEKEIGEKIHDIVGLSFDEFCRTTLLAQGQFTMFINADPKSKSTILEKLTGTEIYAQVGNEIHLRLIDARDRCKTLQDNIEGARLMTEEERQRKLEALCTLKEQYDAGHQNAKHAEKTIAWLEAANDIATSTKEVASRIAVLQQKRDSDLAKQTDATLRDWDASQEVRTLITNAEEEQKTSEILSTQLDSGRQEFLTLLAGQQAMQLRALKQEQELAQLKQEQQQDNTNLQMYQERGTAKMLADAIVQKRQEMDDKTKKVQAEEDSVQKENKKQGELQRTLQELQEAERAQAQKEEALHRQTERIQLQQLSDRLTQSGGQVSSLEKAATLLASYREKKQDTEEQGRKLESLKAQRVENEENIKEMLKRYNSQAKNTTRLHNRYDGMKELSDHLSAIRSRFKEEQVCPLCGSEVRHLHGDDDISTTLLQALQDYQEADRYLQQLKEKGGELRGRENSLRKDIEEGEHRQNTLRESLRAAEEETKTAFSTLEIDYRAEDAQNDLDQRLVQAQAQYQRDNNTLLDASNRINLHNIAARNLAKAKEETAKADTALQNSKKEAEKHAALASALHSQRQQAQVEMEQLISQFRNIVTPAPFQESHLIYPADDAAWQQVDFATLTATIDTMASNCERRNAAIDQQSKKAEQASADINYLEQRLQVLQHDVPELRADSVSATTSITSDFISPETLKERADAFDKKIRDIVSKQKLITQKRKVLCQQIDAYFTQHPHPTRQQVEELMLHIDNDKIKELREQQDQLTSQWNEQQGVWKNLRRRRENLQLCIPDDLANEIQQWNDDALSQLLSARSVLYQEKQKALDDVKQELTAQQTLLDEDKKRSAQVAQQRKELQEAQGRRDDWDVLDSCFGGDKGDRFKRLAQSYVLRALLQQANYYMLQLTNRYTLCCDDGSLIINVEDKHQGGVIRPAASLSGGESFIASLALALGLASINKDKINVDTLFIDEGFGTLSAEALEVVINTLDRLHQLGGRRVGIISHVAELRDRIHTRIQVSPTGPGTSDVTIVSG